MEPKTPKSSTSSDLLFRPITEGLGFHPFSDGLPYAPIAKNPRPAMPNQNATSSPVSPGAGATVAGPPRIAQLQKPSFPISQVPIRQISVPVAKIPTPLELAEQDSLEESPPGFSYLFKRIMAYSLDGILSVVVGLMLLGAYLWQQNSNPELLFNFSVIAVIAGFLLVFNWFSVTIQEVVFRTSIGKRMFGLMLPGNRFKLFLRALLFITSIASFGMGLIWSLFDRQKCCWHDRFVGIQPKEFARY
jgi:hypothetical protein